MKEYNQQVDSVSVIEQTSEFMQFQLKTLLKQTECTTLDSISFL